MRNRLLGGMAFVSLAAAVIVSLAQGQPSPPRELPPALRGQVNSTPKSDTIQPVLGNGAAETTIKRNAVPFDRFRQFETLPELTKQTVLSAMMGMEWLYRYNQPNGVFLYGYLPALGRPMEGDNQLHQAMATFALARAARFTGDERYIARAHQAVLTLLTSTVKDSENPAIRRPIQPSIICNRLAAAGYLLMTIHELPDPASDLLGKADELAVFIRSKQLENGSFSYTDTPSDASPAIESDGNSPYCGPAMFALCLTTGLGRLPKNCKLSATESAFIATTLKLIPTWSSSPG